MELYTPPDNEEAKNAPGKGYYGVCGAAAIAALERRPVADILQAWELTNGKFKGYAPVKEVIAVLRNLGYNCARKNGKKAKEFPEIDTEQAIVRIQWLKEDGTEFYWKAATPNTHYVLMQKFNGERWVFCNSWGWFRADSETGKKMLALGYVSSYLEVFKP